MIIVLSKTNTLMEMIIFIHTVKPNIQYVYVSER